MPSSLHEGLLVPFRNRPQLAAELLGDILRVRQAEPIRTAYDSVAIAEADLTQIMPTEYRADLVVLHRSQDASLGIVIEVQLNQDENKEYTWPLYAAAVRAKHRCRAACVLVVTSSAEVAAWAARPIQVGPTPSETFQPIVCGPSAIPCITDVEEARRSPELAVLSAQAHSEGPHAFEVAHAALAAAVHLDAERRPLYSDLIFAANESLRKQLEDAMREGGYEYKSTFAREHFGKGLAEGTAAGKAEGRAEALLVFLNARHVALTAEQRERILACRDPQVLDDWIARAAVATSADDVLHEG